MATAVPEQTKAYVLQRRPLIIWWAHTDSNRGPKDYEFANDTVALGFIGLHEETVQYAKEQRNQYVSER